MRKLNQFSLSPHALGLLKQFEGLRLTAYQDAVKIWTIGYGHTGNVRKGDVITEKEAETLLKRDVVRFEADVNNFLNELKVTVTQHQFDALVLFSYNVGTRAFQKSTLAKKLYLLDPKDPASLYAVADQFLRWNKAGGKVLAGLTKRRQQERMLFLVGEA